MEWSLIVAGTLATMSSIEDFTLGSRDYLQPMLRAEFEEVPKRTMHCGFHYVSSFFVLSALALLGLGVLPAAVHGSLAIFIGANWAAFATIQLLIVLTCRIERGLIRMCQWMLFSAIAVFCFIA
jgi:hypothetical protein